MQRNIASVTTGMTSRVASDSPVTDTESRAPTSPRELGNLYDRPTLSIYFQDSKGFAVREPTPPKATVKNTRFSERLEIGVHEGDINKHWADAEGKEEETADNQSAGRIEVAMADVKSEPDLQQLAKENRALYLSDRTRLHFDLPYRGRGEQEDGRSATMDDALDNVHRHMVAHWTCLDETERHAPPPGGWKVRQAPTRKVDVHPADKNQTAALIKRDILPDWPDWR
ncbi:hypothetical protein [Variovorax saccharolyticus]|uniref:hypothetical protein n=1 Tax=Variovorax saccharolyticus TaxID=3053516 RepID=UPI002574D3EC|nr:hypothetical protein [Variovorax sp. J31P216]MDM0029926.1 hypothetical protein [Variovorax sp. J31P216]